MRLLIVALRRSKHFLSVLVFILVLMMIKYHSGRESSPHGVSIRGMYICLMIMFIFLEQITFSHDKSALGILNTSE